MRVTRRYRFCASHRLDTPAMTPAENQRLYGKCNNPHGHGHDYELDVTVEGAIDETGRVVDRPALDAWVQARVIETFDHRNLSVDVPNLKGVVATTENLATAIRDALVESWPLPAKLAHLRISETARNVFELEVK